jgi:hypothetical protein
MYFKEVLGSGMKCDLSRSSLEAAAQQVGPSFSYDLYVHPSELFVARNLLRSLSCDIKDNPFAPYVNLSSWSFKKSTTWVLSANEHKVGSEGVS